MSKCFWLMVAASAAWLGMIVGVLHFLLGVEIKTIADSLLAAMAVVVVTFTFLYGFRSNWRKYRIGRIFLAGKIFLSMVLVQNSVSVWVSTDYPYRQQIRLVIYFAGFVAYVGMLVALWREQQRDRG